MKQRIREYLSTVMIVLIIVLARLYVFPVYQVDGQSMNDTLAHGDKVLATNVFDIERFDVVVIDMPQAQKKYIKRVIGLPGETIEYKNNALYINNQIIEEPFLSNNKAIYQQNVTHDIAKMTIPEGTYYCIGDNRRNSQDSRKLGPFNKEQIISEAILVYWPLDHLKTME